MRSMLKRLAPRQLLYWREMWKSYKRNADNKGSSNREVFSRIYRDKIWGMAEQGAFFSGSGSYDDNLKTYVEFVRAYIATNKISTVTEIGCGDFSVARQYADLCSSYSGVDVVPGLIAYNNRQFGNERIRFIEADATMDDLPPAELCIIRQVLQHLPNADIALILARLEGYPHVLITEHMPAREDFTKPNIDKLRGDDIRIFFGSAVCVDAAPFDQAFSTVLETACSTPSVKAGEYLRTVARRPAAAA